MQSNQNHAEVILALDIGGTFIKSALFSGGKLLRKLPQVPTCSAGTREDIEKSIRLAVRQAETFDRVAVSIPGPFDYSAGIFRMKHKFAAVDGCRFRDLSGGTDAVFLHDANAFLLGELTCGAARGFSRAGGVTLGTGLGAAFAVDGKPLTSPAGSPAENVSLWNKPFRGGIAEDAVSARALLAKYPAQNVKEIALRAKEGDRAAQEVWLGYGSALFELLTGWNRELAPEVIVVGGQIARDLELFGPVPPALPVRRSLLGEDAALYGAYEHARKRESE